MLLLTPIRSISSVRWLKLISGLLCFGIGVACMKRADLGLPPWEVLNDGVSYHTDWMLGTSSIVVGILVLLFWIPLGERADVGTLLNMLLVGTFTNTALKCIPGAFDLPIRAALLLMGILSVGLGSALYLGSRLGAGPRDGLMVGLHRRTGLSVRRIRTGMEITVLVLGYLLHGTVGFGTLIFALGIGPVIHWMMEALGQRLSDPVPAESIGE